jgi:hypothetical protein
VFATGYAMPALNLRVMDSQQRPRVVLKGEDIVVLLKLTQEPAETTVRSLEAQTGIPRSVIHRSLVRLAEARLLDAESRRVNLSRAEELLFHAVKYMFPTVRGGEVRACPPRGRRHR